MIQILSVSLLAGFLLRPPCALALRPWFEDSKAGFSIEAPEGWQRQIPRFEGVLAAFTSPDVKSSLNITFREVPGTTTVDTLQWENLFSPNFEYILIQQKGRLALDGQKAIYCLYSLKPGPFREEIEGKRPRSYLNFVIVRDTRLYSLTYSAEVEDFAALYPQFTSSVKSLKFRKLRSAGSQNGS